MDKANRSARVAPAKIQQVIEAAGFTDVKQEVIKAFVCPWSSNRRERDIARWFNLGLSLGLESLSMVPLVKTHGLTYEEVQDLCAKVKDEICTLQYHTYCHM